jgi:hypothetical protein
MQAFDGEAAAAVEIGDGARFVVREAELAAEHRAGPVQLHGYVATQTHAPATCQRLRQEPLGFSHRIQMHALAGAGVAAEPRVLGDAVDKKAVWRRPRAVHRYPLMFADDFDAAAGSQPRARQRPDGQRLER